MTGIIAGGAVALSCGKLFSEQLKSMMMTVCGIAVLIGLALSYVPGI